MDVGALKMQDKTLQEDRKMTDKLAGPDIVGQGNDAHGCLVYGISLLSDGFPNTWAQVRARGKLYSRPEHASRHLTQVRPDIGTDNSIS